MEDAIVIAQNLQVDLLEKKTLVRDEDGGEWLRLYPQVECTDTVNLILP